MGALRPIDEDRLAGLARRGQLGIGEARRQLREGPAKGTASESTGPRCRLTVPEGRRRRSICSLQRYEDSRSLSIWSKAARVTV